MILPAGRGGDSFIEERVLPDPDETEGQSSERICRSKATKIDRAAGHTFVERGTSSLVWLPQSRGEEWPERLVGPGIKGLKSHP